MKSSEENEINTYPNIKECLDGNNQTLKTLKGCRNDEKLSFVAKEPKIMNCVLHVGRDYFGLLLSAHFLL